MFAIVTIAGQQFKVEEGQELFVHQLDASEGDNVSFDQVHLIDDEGTVKIGRPLIESAKVTASVIGHQKGDKVIVFKKSVEKATKRKTVIANASPKSKLKGSLPKSARYPDESFEIVFFCPKFFKL